jgi:hypothetical protein
VGLQQPYYSTAKDGAERPQAAPGGGPTGKKVSSQEKRDASDNGRDKKDAAAGLDEVSGGRMLRSGGASRQAVIQ